MSPILIRPVREQLEHDRLIRFLVPKYQERFEVIANVGDTQPAPVKLGGPAALYPDIVLLSSSKIAGLVEVETGESTNNLEAMAQWQHFSRARVPFHLYVPTLMLDAALRFCEAYNIGVTEIWTYRSLLEGFDLVRAFHNPSAVAKTPKGISVVAKLLPPVTPEQVEPEKDAKLAELTSLVELANKTFRVAAGKSAAANAAAKAAAASARAAARVARAAAKAEKAAAKEAEKSVDQADDTPASTARGKAAGQQSAQAAAQAPAAKRSAAKEAAKTRPVPASRAGKAVRAGKTSKPAKRAKKVTVSRKRAVPAKKIAAKAARPSKPVRKAVAKSTKVHPKSGSRPAGKAAPKSKSKPLPKSKSAAARPRKGTGKR